MPKSLHPHLHHLDKRLRFRLRIYFTIAIIFIGILIFNIVRGSLRPDYGLIAVTLGLIIGVITSRMFHISWDHDAKKVVSRLDVYGIVILILYIGLEIMRSNIITLVTQEFEVGTIGFALLAGIMIGRVLGTRGKILLVLKEQKIFG